MELTQRTLSRRDALKILAALTGAAAISGVPAKWATPLVQVGALPAHAQCSPTETTAAFTIVNITEGTATLTLLRGASEPFMQTTVGPMSLGCMVDIPPDEYTMCFEIVGGNCPGSRCMGVTLLAGTYYLATVTCVTELGGLDITIEEQ